MELLRIKEEKETYKVINKKLYAFTESTNEKRDISEHGCEVLKELLEENNAEKEEIKELEAKIEAKRAKINDNYKLVGDLYKCGYCDISTEYSKKNVLTGKTYQTYKSHAKNCVNNKGGNK